MIGRIGRAEPLLALIRNHEAPAAAARIQGRTQYGVVYSGIRAADRPERPLTEMTVAEVIAWQRTVVNRGARSSAAGAYQFIRKTLAGLGLPQDRLFDELCQDEAAMILLDRRGWAKCEAGQMSVDAFADQLAREWASFPVMADQKGQQRRVKRGESYYAGDGLNAAYVKPDDVLAAIRASLPPVPSPASPAPVSGLFASIIAAIAAFFRRSKPNG